MDTQSVDFCSIDVIWNGFSESLELRMTTLMKTNVSCHNFNGHLSTFISMHFCSLVNNFKIGEVDVNDVPWKDEIFSDIPKIEEWYFLI